MPVHLIRKLECFVELSAEERASIESVSLASQKALGPREDIYRAGDRPLMINMMLEGWAYRYTMLEDGRRQITGLLLPGDICDLRASVLKAHDHSVATVGPTRIAQVSKDQLLALATKNPNLERAFWWLSVVEESTARAWITNVGQRSASERLAHLFCEIFLRLQAVGLTTGKSCPLPLTQELLADAAGISTVHVNRSLMDLRNVGLVAVRDKTLTIDDFEALGRLAMFDPSYLHLGSSAHRAASALRSAAR